MGGGSDSNEASKRLGLPVDLIDEAEGYGKKDVDIYPENILAVNVFYDMLTQWRSGPSGATGLDYKALPVVLSMRRVKVAEREALFDDLRVMEVAALKTMREK